MIVVMGEGAVRQGAIAGDGLLTAGRYHQEGSTVGFLGSLSSDERGQHIFSYLIERTILFEPESIHPELPSSSDTVPFEKSVALALSEDAVISMMECNPDTFCIVIMPSVLACEHLVSVLLNGLEKCEIAPVLILDAEGQPCPAPLAAKAGMVIDGDISCGGYTLQSSQEGYVLSWEGGTVQFRAGCTKERIIANMERWGLFGKEGEAPTLRLISQEEGERLSKECIC